MTNPLLSVVTVTYNHEPFIAKCIEGVLRQQVSFPIEFVIGEDCSTDGTRRICQEYAEKYPDLIHLIISDSNVGGLANERRVMTAARGKYLAYCEGDDYWTDPLKLQKQVDFLESHPDYSVCFHRTIHYNAVTDKYFEDGCGALFKNGEEGIDISLDLYISNWITQPLSMVMRASDNDLGLYERYKHFKDMQQIYHLLKRGKGYLFSFVGGVRTIHPGGDASMISVKKYCDTSLLSDGEFYHKEPNKWTRKIYMDTLQVSVRVYAPIDRCKALQCCFRHLIVSKRPKTFLKNLMFIIKAKKNVEK